MERFEPLLIGNYTIAQDDGLYRFTEDAVLLARFPKAKPGERVADFCAGSGIVGLHFYAENEEKVSSVVCFEMEEALARLCAHTVERNGLREIFSVEQLRLQEIPARYDGAFSLIFANPPYFGKEAGRGAARSECALTVAELAHAAARCLRPRGRFAVVHRAERVAELLSALRAERLEPKQMQFVAGREGRKPYAVLVLAVKGGKTGVDVLPTRCNARGSGGDL